MRPLQILMLELDLGLHEFICVRDNNCTNVLKERDQAHPMSSHSQVEPPLRMPRALKSATLDKVVDQSNSIRYGSRLPELICV